MIDLGPGDSATATPMTGVGAHIPAPGRSMLQWARSFLENAPVPLAIVERRENRVIYANFAFQRAHRVPATDIQPTIASLFDASAATAVEALVDAAATARIAPAERVITLNDGHDSLHCSAWPLHDGESADAPMVIIELRPETDAAAEAALALHIAVAQRLVISALNDQMRAEASGAAEKAAEAANIAKDRFLTTMSHELRTPLNAIGGYAELIELGLRGPVTPAQREDLGRIQRAQVHLLGLINSVLHFAKLQSGSMDFDMKAVGLEASLDAVLDMLMPQLTRKRLTYVKLNRAPAHRHPLVVQADPEKLRQIFINLLTNAVKFTAIGGSITATCDAQGDRAIVHIRDTGRGIPQDELPRIFDPFVQVGRKLSSNDQGVGLGLSISRDLARAMEGDLSATSVVDAGSTFTLTLKCISTGAPPSP